MKQTLLVAYSCILPFLLIADSCVIRDGMDPTKNYISPPPLQTVSKYMDVYGLDFWTLFFFGLYPSISCV